MFLRSESYFKTTTSNIQISWSPNHFLWLLEADHLFCHCCSEAGLGTQRSMKVVEGICTEIY